MDASKTADDVKEYLISIETREFIDSATFSLGRSRQV